jgi:hypothetical protein
VGVLVAVGDGSSVGSIKSVGVGAGVAIIPQAATRIPQHPVTRVITCRLSPEFVLCIVIH